MKLSNKDTKVNWIVTEKNITVNFNGKTHIVSRTDSLSEKLLTALRNKEYNEIPNLITMSAKVETYSKGAFSVKEGVVYVKDYALPDTLSKKILHFMKENLPHEPLVKFANNLLNNPSNRAVNELFKFLEHNDHPITEDGKFIAYKRVKGNFKDIYSGTFDNSVGKVVEVPRNKVDENSEKTCSYGLHVANWDYAHNVYGSNNCSTDIMLEVEVDPADVVAVPSDYNNSKMRVCRYVVVNVVDSEHSSDTHLKVSKNPDLDNQDDDDCSSCDDECTYCESDYDDDDDDDVNDW